MSVIRKEAYFQSENGRNQIRTLIWQDADSEPRAVVQIAHGVAEHIGRYEETAVFLAERGFLVCGNDHLGHGKSVESIDELGYIDENNGYVFMIRDMHRLYRIIHKKHPTLPYFLFGHSLGSFMARIYVASFAQDLAGLILCGSGRLPRGASFLDAAVEDILDRLGAAGDENAVLTNLSNKLSAKMLGEDDPLAWLSQCAENRERYREDPLCGFPLKNAGAKNVAMLGIKAEDSQWMEKLPPGFPVLLISGAKDPVGLNGRAVLAIADGLLLAGQEPVVILYPGDRHEILHEDDRERVLHDIEKWLEAALSGTSFYD